jgi:uncharacterized protein (UPF0335 family)
MGYGVAGMALDQLDRIEKEKAMLQRAISNGFDVPAIRANLLKCRVCRGR